jgi:putative hydrolase of the HAD superfamily
LETDCGVFRKDSLMDRLVEDYTHPILSALPLPLDGAPDVLAALAARNIKLALICNTGRTPGKILRIILERLELAKYFSVQTFSDEVGLRKPHPEIFERTLAAMGVQAREALHVGDMLSSDIVGARAVGMRAVHFRHEQGIDWETAGVEIIHSLPELLPIVNREISRSIDDSNSR